jgi:hypothetical protein
MISNECMFIRIHPHYEHIICEPEIFCKLLLFHFLRSTMEHFFTPLCIPLGDICCLVCSDRDSSCYLPSAVSFVEEQLIIHLHMGQHAHISFSLLRPIFNPTRPSGVHHDLHQKSGGQQDYTKVHCLFTIIVLLHFDE